MRERITEKSSAARGRVIVSPFVLPQDIRIVNRLNTTSTVLRTGFSDGGTGAASAGDHFLSSRERCWRANTSVCSRVSILVCAREYIEYFPRFGGKCTMLLILRQPLNESLLTRHMILRLGDMPASLCERAFGWFAPHHLLQTLHSNPPIRLSSNGASRTAVASEEDWERRSLPAASRARRSWEAAILRNLSRISGK